MPELQKKTGVFEEKQTERTTVSRSIVSVFFVGKYPCRCGKYPRFVLMVAVVEFDGRMTYRQKDHRLALLLVPYFCL